MVKLYLLIFVPSTFWAYQTTFVHVVITLIEKKLLFWVFKLMFDIYGGVFSNSWLLSEEKRILTFTLTFETFYLVNVSYIAILKLIEIEQFKSSDHRILLLLKTSFKRLCVHDNK